MYGSCLLQFLSPNDDTSSISNFLLLCLLSQSLMTLMDTFCCKSVLYCHVFTALKNMPVMPLEASFFFSGTEIFTVSTVRENISMNEHDGRL